MDFLPIAVLILFVLLGGGIAVFADELGRRIGKKRLSLGRRFRPKTTARIITFISGCSITLLTIILISVLSSDVRVWLREGHRAIEERDRLNKEVGGLRTEQKDLQGANSRFKLENEKLLVTQHELQSKVTDQQKKLAELQHRFTESESKVAGLEGKIGGLNGRLASLDRSILLKTQEKLAAETSKKKAQASLKKLNLEYAALQKEYFAMSAHDLELDHKLRDKEKEVAAKQEVIDDKTATITGAEAEIGRLNGDRMRLQDEITAAQEDIQLKRNQLSELQVALRQVLNDLDTNAVQVRLRPLIFALGEEVLRVPVPAGTSKDQVRARIETALNQAKNIARDKGAKQANKVDFAGMTELVDDQLRKIPVEVQKDLLASKMAGSDEEQVLIISSLANAFADEGVLVRLAGMPNPIVYTPGQTLAEVRVDGRQEIAKILNSLNELGPRIRAKALQDKMIPIQKGDMSLGTVSAEDILLLVKQIQDAGGSVRVRARAKHLTRAADPLLLDFDVR